MLDVGKWLCKEVEEKDGFFKENIFSEGFQVFMRPYFTIFNLNGWQDVKSFGNGLDGRIDEVVSLEMKFYQSVILTTFLFVVSYGMFIEDGSQLWGIALYEVRKIGGWLFV